MASCGISDLLWIVGLVLLVGVPGCVEVWLLSRKVRRLEVQLKQQASSERGR